MTRPVDRVSNVVVKGIFLVHNSCAKILFNPGSTHSFISESFVRTLGLKVEPLGYVLEVDTPFKNTCITASICRSCCLAISRQKLIVDLIVLEMSGYDVILGMDWLSSN